MKTDLIVGKVDKARQMLALASNASEAKQVADMARAAEVYAKRQNLSEECITYATGVKVDALVLLGEFQKAAPKATGTKGQLAGAGPGRGKTGSTKTEPPVSDIPTLEETLGKGGKKVSSEAQALAELKEDDPATFEQVRAGKVSVRKGANQVRTKKRKKKKLTELQDRAQAAEACQNGDVLPWEIIHGDCLEELPRLKEPPRLICMDSPYNIGVDYGKGKKADLLSREAFLSLVGRWARASYEALADDGSLWAVINDENAAAFYLAIEAVGFTHRNWIKWYETFGVNCTNCFNRTSRHLLYAVKKRKRFVFNPDAVNRLSDRQAKYNDKRADPGGKILDDVWTDIPRLTGTCDERLPGYPTQLPIALLNRIVGCCSDPGDLVVDPFSGSATTGVAAVRLARRYIGIEREDKYVRLSRLRLQGESHVPS